MIKSIGFLVFVAYFTNLLFVCFGAPIIMALEGGWWIVGGVAWTLSTLTALPHSETILKWTGYP